MSDLTPEERIESWRGMLSHDDLHACESLIADLDAADPRLGWGSLDRADIMRNVPVLLQTVEQRAACANCPGLVVCRDRSGPRGAIVKRLRPHVTAADGHVIVRAFFGPCNLAVDAYVDAAPTRRGRRTGDADGSYSTPRDRVPF